MFASVPVYLCGARFRQQDVVLLFQPDAHEWATRRRAGRRGEEAAARRSDRCAPALLGWVQRRVAGAAARRAARAGAGSGWDGAGWPGAAAASRAGPTAR